MEICAASSNKLLCLLFTPEVSCEADKRRGSSTPAFVSVCSQFKGQLSQLIQKIKATSPHYVRCIKPNDQSSPGVFTRSKVLEQLRHGGIISAVQVARSGFKYRYLHSEFFSRFRIIANPSSPLTSRLPNHIYSGLTERSADLCLDLWSAITDPTLSSGSANLKQKEGKDLESWLLGSVDRLSSGCVQVGRTMVFVKQDAFNFLENRLFKRRYGFVSRIQALLRGVLTRKTTPIELLRMMKYAILVQAWWKCVYWKRIYRKIIQGIIRVQSLWRGIRCRRLYFDMYRNSKAIHLQRFMRIIWSRRRLNRFKNAVVKIQARQRLWKAKETATWLRFLKEECF